MLKFIDQHNAFVQSISTVFLVLITIYYAWQTHKSVKELGNQRTLGIRPVILAKNLVIKDHEAQGGKYSCIKCELENIGNGPALKIHIGIYDPETSKQIATSTNYIDYLTKDGITDDSHIHIENTKFNKIVYQENNKGEMFSRLKLVLHYKDLYENLYFSERIFSYKKSDQTFTAMLGSFELKSKTIDKIKKRFSFFNSRIKTYFKK